MSSSEEAKYLKVNTFEMTEDKSAIMEPVQKYRQFVAAILGKVKLIFLFYLNFIKIIFENIIISLFVILIEIKFCISFIKFLLNFNSFVFGNLI